MRSVGPTERYYNPSVRPLLQLIRELSDRPGIGEMNFEKQGLKVRLRRSDATGAAQS